VNPDLVHKARNGAAQAKALADALGSANPVASAAAALAAECLELSVAPFAWQSSHAIVRDLGVVPFRESLLRDCAFALRLASDAARRLGIHGASASRTEEMTARLEHLASAIQRAAGGLDTCEDAIAVRIAEPRLAEIALESRLAALQFTPNEHNLRLARLSKEVESALAVSAEARASVASLEERHRDAIEQAQRLTLERERLEDEIRRASQDVQVLDTSLGQLEQQRHDTEHDRERAADRLAKVRVELEALRQDPRDRIRDAVARALQQLPDDAFDCSVEGAHVR